MRSCKLKLTESIGRSEIEPLPFFLSVSRPLKKGEKISNYSDDARKTTISSFCVLFPFDLLPLKHLWVSCKAPYKQHESLLVLVTWWSGWRETHCCGWLWQCDSPRAESGTVSVHHPCGPRGAWWPDKEKVRPKFNCLCSKRQKTVIRILVNDLQWHCFYFMCHRTSLIFRSAGILNILSDRTMKQEAMNKELWHFPFRRSLVVVKMHSVRSYW